jgi:uncharacterized membrane-anchored protein
MNRKNYLSLLLLSHLVSAALPTTDRQNTPVLNFNYRSGTITLGNNLAGIRLDSTYRYLDSAQSEFVLEKLWGNPPTFSNLGMIFPSNISPTDSNGWAIVIQYEEAGYVKDKDADKINYDKLLKQIQKEILGRNAEREKKGYLPIELVGWAEKPYYDRQAKKLYWAKELKFGNEPAHTLNYDVRILGRKGYLVLRVVSTMDQLAEIKPHLQELIREVDFASGNRYADFNPKVDKVAAYGIAALVAGGVLAKVGFFKLLIAGIIALKKFIIIAIIALAAIVQGFLKRRKQREQVLKVEEKVRDRAE